VGITMNSQTIQDTIESWAQAKNFNAPYGVLTGNHTSKNGTKYKSVTFGRARSLDATVEIYNRNFIIVRTSRHGSQVFKKYEDLSQFLETL
jgi:hypothetical protein